MAKIMKNNLGNFLVILLIFALVASWIFSAWPQIWQNPRFPPKIQEAKAAEVTIWATLFDATDEYSPSPGVVFISDQVGYAFFVNTAKDNVAYSKTTDGGATWGSAVALSGVMGTDKNWANVAVWYDQWTPGGTGTKIHIVAAEASTDDIWYNWLDTSDDSMRTDAIVVILDLGAFTPATSGGPSITKSTDGYLFVLGFAGVTGAVYKSIDGGDSWGNTSLPTADVDDADKGQLLPLSGGDILLILQDLSTDTAQSKVYDEATDTWDTSWTSIDTWVENTAYDCTWGASLYKSTGDIYLAGNTKPDGGTGYPLKAYKFTESTRTWSTLTDIAAVAEALQVIIAVDENNGDLYAIYIRGGSAGATTDVYYKKSTDGGSSWEAESAKLNVTADDYRYVRSNFTSNERIYAVWYDDDDNDLFGNTVADLTPPVGELTISAPASASFPAQTVSTISQTSSTTLSYIEVSDTRGGSPGWNVTMTSNHSTIIGPVKLVAGSNDTVGTSGKYDGTYGVVEPVKRYEIVITTGGGIGTAICQWRVCDATCGTWTTGVTTAATVALEKGINTTFGDATYVVDDEWHFGVDVFPYTGLYVTPSAITIVSGSCTNCTTGTAGYLTGTGATSDSKTLMTAPSGTGTGTFRQDEGLELTIHANSISGTYSATLTFTAL